MENYLLHFREEIGSNVQSEKKTRLLFRERSHEKCAMD